MTAAAKTGSSRSTGIVLPRTAIGEFGVYLGHGRAWIMDTYCTVHRPNPDRRVRSGQPRHARSSGLASVGERWWRSKYDTVLLYSYGVHLLNQTIGNDREEWDNVTMAQAGLGVRRTPQFRLCRTGKSKHFTQTRAADKHTI